MVDLEIIFNSKPEVELRLSRDGEIFDLLMVPLDSHFDTVLVTVIDKILKRNRIEPLSLTIVNVEGLADPSSVAYHIALAVAAALKIK